MDTFNLFRDETIGDESDPPGYRAQSAQLAPRFGASRLAMTVYDLPPGQAICPYHYEYAEEEWLIVLEGTPTLRTPDGSSQLAPWDVCFFPTGPEGAHGVRNETNTTARVMMFSDLKWPAATVYPDSDKVGIHIPEPNREDGGMFRRSSKVEYFTDEPGV